MKPNILLIFTLIVLTTSSSIGYIAEAQASAIGPTVVVTQVFWGTTGNPMQAAPGDINTPLNIVIQNYGTESITSTNAELSLYNSPFTDSATGSFYSTAGYSGTINSGQSITLTFYLKIAPDSDIKNYDIPLELKVTTPQYLSPVDVPLTINVPLLGEPSFSLDVDSTSLSPGNSQLYVTLRNSGTGSASSVQLSLSIPTPLTLFGQSNTYTVGSLPAMANFTFPVQLYIPSSAAAAAYQIPVTITYNDPYGTARTDVQIIGFSVGVEQTQFDVKIEPSVLNIGNNTVKLSIVNAGLSASDIELDFNPPTILTIADGVNRWVFPAIANGGTVTVEIPVYAPESSAGGMGQGSLSISYTNTDGIFKTESRSFSLAVLQPSKPNIVLIPRGTSLTSGSNNAVTLAISNEGDSDVYSLDVTVTTPSATGTNPFVLLGSDNNWHFDQVKSKSSVTVNMTIAAASGISGTYPLTVALSYRNQAGNTFTETRTLGLLVSLAAIEWQSPLAIYTNINSLTAGYINRPIITIRNSGESPITSVSVQISAKENISTSTTSSTSTTTSSNALIITSGTESWRFNSIKPDLNVTITPEIFASLGYVDTSQVITLSISYLDNLGNLLTESRTIGFTVKGAIIIAVQGEQVSPTSVSAGGNLTITGNLLNKGNTAGLYSTVSLKPNPNFTSSGSQYIGDLTTDTLIPFSLLARAQRNLGEGTYPVTAVLTYENGYGETFSKEITVQISISKPTVPSTQNQESMLGTLALIRILFLAALVAVVGVGLITIFKVYRGKKRTVET